MVTIAFQGILWTFTIALVVKCVRDDLFLFTRPFRIWRKPPEAVRRALHELGECAAGRPSRFTHKEVRR